ncbi:MAG: hypothetical protein ABI693_28350 [Bryobacteraceae bacterium]
MNKKSTVSKPRRGSKAAEAAKDSTPDPHTEAFQRGVEIRQDVDELTPDGKLPLGVNFVRTKKSDGTPGIKRVRVNLV